jgi:hypothetical protein
MAGFGAPAAGAFGGFAQQPPMQPMAASGFGAPVAGGFGALAPPQQAGMLGGFGQPVASGFGLPAAAAPAAASLLLPSVCSLGQFRAV